ncbi:MAG: YabP/YqfC family sporulation protein [Candidatus Flemingiibacterium sp.]
MNDSYKKQEIILRDRSYLKITGVGDVSSFDESGIILSSCNGDITVDGSELRITSLSSDTGEIVVEGRIGGVFYFEERPAKKRGFFGRKE